MQHDVGILSAASYVPPLRMGAGEIAARTGIPEGVIRDKFGIEAKAVPGPGDHPCAMAGRAADVALQRAGVDPLEVDVVLSISEEFKEHPLMVSGIKIQQLVGARNAWAVDVAQRCCTAIAALKLAQGLMASDPRIRTVLLAGGYRNGDLIDFSNPRVSFMYNLAAGAGALVLRRGGPNRLVGTALRTDGDFADDVLVPAGGTVQPLTAETVGTPAAMLEVTDVDGMKARLGERSHGNFLGVIDDALAEAGATRADVDYLALLHMKRSAHLAMLADLGLTEAQSTYLSDVGHVGQIDPILSLERALASGAVRDGSLVVMASAGISYAWGSAAIRWGAA
jgi:3-oxoacyl-[acyl-carrier-protein] synthase-3